VNKAQDDLNWVLIQARSIKWVHHEASCSKHIYKQTIIKPQIPNCYSRTTCLQVKSKPQYNSLQPPMITIQRSYLHSHCPSIQKFSSYVYFINSELLLYGRVQGSIAVMQTRPWLQSSRQKPPPIHSSPQITVQLLLVMSILISKGHLKKTSSKTVNNNKNQMFSEGY